MKLNSLLRFRSRQFVMISRNPWLCCLADDHRLTALLVMNSRCLADVVLLDGDDVRFVVAAAHFYHYHFHALSLNVTINFSLLRTRQGLNAWKWDFILWNLKLE
jgi:hypothetical protein